MARYNVTIKQGREVVKEYNLKAKDPQEAKAWGKKQAVEFNVADAEVVVMTAQE